jgi:hypothetical protein
VGHGHEGCEPDIEEEGGVLVPLFVWFGLVWVLGLWMGWVGRSIDRRAPQSAACLPDRTDLEREMAQDAAREEADDGDAVQLDLPPLALPPFDDMADGNALYVFWRDGMVSGGDWPYLWHAHARTRSVVAPVKCVVRTAFPLYLDVNPFCKPQLKQQSQTKTMELWVWGIWGVWMLVHR